MNDKILRLISNSRFLHNFASFFISSIPLVILHNFGKYNSIRKILYLIHIDNVQGDYTEFGCYTGASLNHALLIEKKINKKSKKIFYGFDSFKGFPENLHKLFKSENFIPNYKFTKKLEKKFNNCKIIPGFFNESLKRKDLNDKIKKISFCFIDCDLKISLIPVIKFIKKRLSNGSFIMIDDFYNLDINGDTLKDEIYKNFQLNENIFIHNYFGNSGIVFRYYSK